MIKDLFSKYPIKDARNEEEKKEWIEANETEECYLLAETFMIDSLTDGNIAGIEAENMIYIYAKSQFNPRCATRGKIRPIFKAV